MLKVQLNCGQTISEVKILGTSAEEKTPVYNNDHLILFHLQSLHSVLVHYFLVFWLEFLHIHPICNSQLTFILFSFLLLPFPMFSIDSFPSLPVPPLFLPVSHASVKDLVNNQI